MQMDKMLELIVFCEYSVIIKYVFINLDWFCENRVGSSSTIIVKHENLAGDGRVRKHNLSYSSKFHHHCPLLYNNMFKHSQPLFGLYLPQQQRVNSFKFFLFCKLGEILGGGEAYTF